jgi:hypothetical protein
MSFEWNRMYKWDENYERQMVEDVSEYIREYYNVEEIEDLTQEQINEIEEFCEGFDWQIMMAPGFRYIMNQWEDAQWEASER